MDYMILGIVIAIILGCGFIGRSKGLVKIVLSLVATIVSILFSSVLTTPICEFVKNEMNLMDKVTEIVEESLEDIDMEDVSYIEELQIPNVIKEKIIEGAKELDSPVKDYVVESIASIVLSAVVFVVLFAIASIALGVIISMANIIAKLPIISQANRGAGFVAGLVYGVVVVWVAMVILTAMSSTTWAGDILLTIGDNEILSAIYDSNPIMGVLSNIIEKI